MQKLRDCQMSLSRRSKLRAKRSTLLNPVSTDGEPLIPGLPDDLALQCVLRVPAYEHATCKAVCKRWYSLFGRKEQFFTKRKEFGFRDPWLFVLAHHQITRKLEWKVLDLTHFSWHTIPDMPCRGKVSPQGYFKCVSFPHEGVLFAYGGTITDDHRPLNLVMKYEIYRNRWTAMKKMITARSFPASGAIDGMVYVAGGNDAEQDEIHSAEVLDPKKGTWRPIANMKFSMTIYDAVVFNGKLLVTEGLLWALKVNHLPMGQIYDPVNNTWELMAPGLRYGWTGPSAVVCGELFVVRDQERLNLEVYDKETDAWDAVEGPPAPEHIGKSFCVSSWDCKIFIVGHEFRVAVGNITRLEPSADSGKKCRFSVDWKMVDVPDTFSNLTPSNALVLFA